MVYNIQTQDKVTQDMRTTAETAGVPVVEVTETLPEGRGLHSVADADRGVARKRPLCPVIICPTISEKNRSACDRNFREYSCAPLVTPCLLVTPRLQRPPCPL